MEKTELTIPGIPVPWKAPFVGSRGAYSPRTALMYQLRNYLSSTYTGPFYETAINCSLFFYMPIPESASKKKKALMLSGQIRPATIPDRANLCKMYEDVLQGIVYKKDSIIVGGCVEKWYDENPRTLIKIETA